MARTAKAKTNSNGGRAASRKPAAERASKGPKASVPPVSRRKTGGRFAKGNRTGSQWKPGQSGNPSGRPKSRLAAAFAEFADSDRAQTMFDKAVELAEDGSERLLAMFLSEYAKSFNHDGAAQYVPSRCATLDEVAGEQARLGEAFALGLVDKETFDRIHKLLDSLAATIDRRDDRAWGAQVAAMVRWHQGAATEDDLKLITGAQEKEGSTDGDGRAA